MCAYGCVCVRGHTRVRVVCVCKCACVRASMNLCVLGICMNVLHVRVCARVRGPVRVRVPVPVCARERVA